MKNMNRGLTAALVAAGLSEEEALEQIDRVLGAIPVALAAGQNVRLPGVSDLRPKRKWVYVPGSCDRKKREEVRVSMRACAVWKGEPRDCDPPEKGKVSIAPMRRMA